MSSRPLVRDGTVVEKLHNGRATQAKQISGLLSGERLGLWGDGYRKATLHRIDHLAKYPVHLFGELNLVSR